MANILVVDDEIDIVQLIVRFAEHEGHTVTTASNGKEAVALCDKYCYDVIVMDIMMPEMDGFSACKAIRSEQDVPIIMLSALGQEYDKLMGFDLGIDDYVVKPFSPKELMARIRVVVNRHGKKPQLEQTIVFDGLKIEPLGRNVYIDGRKVELTAKEYDLLLYFIKNKDIALSREKILNALWGYDYTKEDRTVDWQVKLLRGKLGKYRSYIVTLRGMGYKFEVNS
ncbi:response regulator transcription factor [Butyricicoccus sp.]|uniref:response regulator transcription factor n=1 Tax=Butyricicoccus sp. TaxID=2049021 RepID=UPI003F1515F7